MSNPEPIIQCSNLHCQAPNAVEDRFCHRCKTPLVKRYLRATVETIEDRQVGELIGDRYLALTTRIFLDTKPSVPPQTPEELPPEIITYLQLSPFSLHIPQVYGQLDGTDVWLLEYGTVPTDKTGKLRHPELIPSITEVWQQATPIRQLNWLRQIIRLWQPLKNKNRVSSLLNPELIRVNGPVVQLLQLQSDGETPRELPELGQLWFQWVDKASPTIKEVLSQLCRHLEEGRIAKAESIMAILDSAINYCRQAYDYEYQVFGCTDSGPNRQNNEDAAYPVNDTLVKSRESETALAIVCDGVGGHEGGEIAAQTTIEYLRDRVNKLVFTEDRSNPQFVFRELTDSVNAVNDLISQQNDSEQRQERQRMGTTLVMTLIHRHEAYLTHVGDSRIYWITPTGCHQVTIDDDLASRETRLGYAVYRTALQYPSAGALIQALGMRESTALHPNVQRLVIDEDCIFLLCSDGLSDFDRVEQYWRMTILPVLFERKPLPKAVKTLVEIANQRNGHDNSTVVLLHCQVKPKPGISSISVSWSDVESVLTESITWIETDEDTRDYLDDTQSFTNNIELEISPLQRQSRQPQYLKILIVVLIFLLGIGTVAFYFIQKELNNKESPQEDLPTQLQEEVFPPPSEKK
jgi:protein phosphatase